MFMLDLYLCRGLIDQILDCKLILSEVGSLSASSGLESCSHERFKAGDAHAEQAEFADRKTLNGKVVSANAIRL